MPNRIREWREFRGLTGEELAELSGTSAQQVSRLETGVRRLSQKWMEKLAPALKVAPADLLPRHGVSGGQPSLSDLPKDPREARLVRFWRRLSPEAQDLALLTLDTWATRMGLDDAENN